MYQEKVNNMRTKSPCERFEEHQFLIVQLLRFLSVVEIDKASLLELNKIACTIREFDKTGYRMSDSDIWKLYCEVLEE